MSVLTKYRPPPQNLDRNPGQELNVPFLEPMWPEFSMPGAQINAVTLHTYPLLKYLECKRRGEMHSSCYPSLMATFSNLDGQQCETEQP